MRFVQLGTLVAAATLAITSSTGAAGAHGYNGNGFMFAPALHSYGGAWPVTVTRSQRDNTTGCLTLKGVSSGQASLVFGGTSYPFGSYVVIDGILVAELSEPLYGQNGALTFSAHASDGNVGHGIFEDLRGGSAFDIGELAFGTKNGC